jgi:hypothetical protein
MVITSNILQAFWVVSSKGSSNLLPLISDETARLLKLSYLVRFCSNYRFVFLLDADSQGKLRKTFQYAPLLGNSSRRLSNITVAAERSSMNGSQESMRPTGTRYPSTAMPFPESCCLVNGLI